MGFEIRSRRQWGVVCTECGVVDNGRWSRTEKEAEKVLERVGECKTCRDRRTVSELPEHHRHRDGHPSFRGNSWYCCGATQLGLIGMDDCAACGEPYPCSALTR